MGKFNLVVLDPAEYSGGDIEKLKSMGCIPFAYVNIGEAETYRSDFSSIDTSILLAPDPHWQDRYYVDICSPEWENLILGERIPRILRSGYCGLFLDLSGLLDEYPETERCAAHLVKRIHNKFSHTTIILDGGSRIVPKVGEAIDGIAIEGLMGYYDFDADAYRIRPDSVINREVVALTTYAKKFKLKIFELDYASAADYKTRADIIVRGRKFGFVPYVGTIELDTLFTDAVHRIGMPGENKSGHSRPK